MGRVLAAIVLLAAFSAPGFTAQEGMEMQRCIWRCLADSSGNADPRYHACVERVCVRRGATPRRSRAAEYLIREQIREGCDGRPGKIDAASVIERDLTGDGNADLIIGHDGITCARGARSSLCGAQVCSVMIYVREGVLLKPAVDDLLGTMVAVGQGPVPTIRWRGHGGAAHSMKWDGKSFQGARATRPAAAQPDASPPPENAVRSGLEGPAASAVTQYLDATNMDCDAAEDGDQPCPIGSLASFVKLFHGRMPGDPAQYAVAFATYELPGGGNSVRQMAIVFKTDAAGAFAPVGRVDETIGIDPRDVRFEPGAIVYTGTVVGPGDARCCPTGAATFTLRVSEKAVTFVDPRESRSAERAVAAPPPARAQMAGAGVPAAAAGKLDAFLDGLLPECDGSAAFNEFRDSLTERYGHDVGGKRLNPRRELAVPLAIRPLLGRTVARNKGQYTQVVVPLKGSFRSLTVASLEFSFGNQNGINAMVIKFADPPDRVREVLGTDVTEGAKRFKAAEEKGDAPASIDITTIAGRGALVCDRST